MRCHLPLLYAFCAAYQQKASRGLSVILHYGLACGLGPTWEILWLMSAWVGLVSTITNHPNLAPIRSVDYGIATHICQTRAMQENLVDLRPLKIVELGNFPSQFVAPASSGQCALFILPACCITKVECFSSCSSPWPFRAPEVFCFRRRLRQKWIKVSVRGKGSCCERPRRVAKIESLHILILLPTRVENLRGKFLTGCHVLLRKNGREIRLSVMQLFIYWFTWRCLSSQNFLLRRYLGA